MAIAIAGRACIPCCACVHPGGPMKRKDETTGTKGCGKHNAHIRENIPRIHANAIATISPAINPMNANHPTQTHAQTLYRPLHEGFDVSNHEPTSYRPLHEGTDVNFHVSNPPQGAHERHADLGRLNCWTSTIQTKNPSENTCNTPMVCNEFPPG